MGKRVLRVYVNPYTHLDADGRPAGSFGADPVGHSPDNPHLGVTSRNATAVAIRNPTEDDRHSIHDVRNVYSGDVLELPDGGEGQAISHHYRMGIRSGDLIPADKETAEECGVPWEEPATRLARAREEAIAKWTANYGSPPSFADDAQEEEHVPPVLRGVGAGETTSQPETNVREGKH